MREEETAWDSKAPGVFSENAGALDPGGISPGIRIRRALRLQPLGYNEPDTTLIAQLMGTRVPGRPREAPRRLRICIDTQSPDEWRSVGLPEIWETPLRTGNLRDPNGPQSAFASESFIDEAAAAAKADALEFRLKLLRGGNGRRQRIPPCAVNGGFQIRRPKVRMGFEAFGETARQGKDPHGPRYRLFVPRSDDGRADR